MMEEPRFQQYDLLEQIAAGGMGEVFRARMIGEHGFKKTVAVKRVLPELCKDPEFVARFVAEAKLSVALSHANIVQIFDLGRSGDDLLLVMEFVDGMDVGRVVRELSARGERPAPAIAVQIASDALCGLAFAHERPGGAVIHCDVSPSNLLLSYSGEVKLTDFGVAQVVDEAMRRRSGARLRGGGTVRYMAPEQLKGEAVDPRTDLYCLAAVLFELLTLEPAFESDLDARRRDPDQPPPDAQGVFPPLAEFLHRCLSARSDARPATASAALGEIARLARDLPPVTRPEIGRWLKELSPPAADRDSSLPRFDDELRRLLRQKGSRSILIPMTVPVMDPAAAGELAPARPAGGRRARPIALIGAGLVLGVLAWWYTAVRQTAEPVEAPPVATVHAAEHPAAAEPAPPPPQPAPPVEVQAVSAAPAPAAAAPRPRGKGKLNIYTDPWSYVFIDGRARGATPLMGVEVEAGSHRIRLRRPSGGEKETVVRVAPGETRLLNLDLPADPDISAQAPGRP
jgi:serine/threonine protein kinase